MARITYTGTAPGQAECVRIGGRDFERGKSYKVTEDVARRLLSLGGFERVRVKSRKENE